MLSWRLCSNNNNNTPNPSPNPNPNPNPNLFPIHLTFTMNCMPYAVCISLLVFFFFKVEVCWLC